jgi:hypothetical protein
MAQATTKHRHWKTSWNRHREIRFVLSCTPDEAKLVKKLAQGQSTQSYLMGLVLEAAQREG